MSSLANSPDLLADSPTLHSDLGAHFDVYDEHLDKKKEQLYAHLGLDAGQDHLPCALPSAAHAAVRMSHGFMSQAPPAFRKLIGAFGCTKTLDPNLQGTRTWTSRSSTASSTRPPPTPMWRCTWAPWHLRHPRALLGAHWPPTRVASARPRIRPTPSSTVRQSRQFTILRTPLSKLALTAR